MRFHTIRNLSPYFAAVMIVDSRMTCFSGTTSTARKTSVVWHMPPMAGVRKVRFTAIPGFNAARPGSSSLDGGARTASSMEDFQDELAHA